MPVQVFGRDAAGRSIRAYWNGDNWNDLTVLVNGSIAGRVPDPEELPYPEGENPMNTSRSATLSIVSGCVFIVLALTQLATSQPIVFPLICFVAGVVSLFRGLARRTS